MFLSHADPVCKEIVLHLKNVLKLDCNHYIAGQGCIAANAKADTLVLNALQKCSYITQDKDESTFSMSCSCKKI